MEVFGRWISIMLCILQLTIMPAKILTMELNKQVEEYLISVTERIFLQSTALRKSFFESIRRISRDHRKVYGQL